MRRKSCTARVRAAREYQGCLRGHAVPGSASGDELVR
jgi:hypothetical protein